MFLLIGHSTERTFRAFVEYTWQQGVPADVLDLAVLREENIATGISDGPDGLTIRIAKRNFDFGAYDAFYTRAFPTDLGHPLANHTLQRIIRAIGGYLNVARGTVVNRPAAGMSNSNKFIHGLILKSYGFQLPETNIVGNALEAGRLRRTQENFISKSCSGVKTRVVEIRDELWNNIDALETAPSIIQRRIPGADVRVHVVGDGLLSERIESSRIDYRFYDRALPPNQYSICDVPDDVAASCRAFCRDQGLLFAGIDFKVTDDNLWFVLEANPMPGYESYDRRQGRRISQALFELLTSHAETPIVTAEVALGLGVRPAITWDPQNQPSEMTGSSPAGENTPGAALNGPFIAENRRPILTALHIQDRLRPEDIWVMDE